MTWMETGLGEWTLLSSPDFHVSGFWSLDSLRVVIVLTLDSNYSLES